jgi:hypothetical protein
MGSNDSRFKNLSMVKTKKENEEMKEKIMMMVASILLEKLKPETLNKWADYGLDLLEDEIEESENTVDDRLVLPVIRGMREAFKIEDND